MKDLRVLYITIGINFNAYDDSKGLPPYPSGHPVPLAARCPLICCIHFSSTSIVFVVNVSCSMDKPWPIPEKKLLGLSDGI